MEMFNISVWGGGTCFTIAKQTRKDRSVSGVWLYHDPSGKMTGYQGYAIDFKGYSNITHEEIFKLYPEMKDRYIKELIKRI